MNNIKLHKGDLPADVDLGPEIAVDTEAMGLNPFRDALCVVQLSAGDGKAHVVQLDRSFDCPNLKALLADKSRLKIFHFARVDVAMMKHWLGIDCTPVWCTKIASKLARTYTDRHGLKDVAREVASTDLSKTQQSSDWGAKDLSKAQKDYAASDVLYLHRLREQLDKMLEREGRTGMAQSCFDFLSTRAGMDLAGFDEIDIFHH